MFTGIIREVGTIVRAEGDPQGLSLTVEASMTAPTVEVGGSVAVNGTCLTAETVSDSVLTFFAVPETVARTTLGRLSVGAAVNLEPALRAGEPLGGHLVQGHVDGVGSVREVVAEGSGRRLTVEAPTELLRYCVEKGSITVEGVSLTVAAVVDGGFELALIPHTLAVTTLGSIVPGATVNLEVDVLAKYVERLLAR